jgi:uncharacterized membrane protein YgcG
MDAAASTIRPRRAALSAVFVLALVMLVFAGAPLARADVSDFTFDSFDADMLLTRTPDGHAALTVTETIVARFPDEDQNKGIVRVIPDDYNDIALHTEIVSVTDGAGSPVPYEVEESRREVRVLTGDDTYVRGVQTYVITYTQRDTIRSFVDTDADEFYRDINGTGGEQPFGEVSARLRVDADLGDAALEGAASCYQGRFGSDTPCDISRSGGPGAPLTWSARATNLDAGENMTIAVGFVRGTFVPGEVFRTPLEQFSVDNAPALAGVSLGAVGLGLAGVGAAVVARRKGRDAEGRGVIVPEYGPPDDVDVLEGAELVQRGRAGVPAAVLDTAIAGHLRIIDDPADAKRLTLELVRADDATPLRRGVLAAVFGADAEPGARASLGPHNQDAATALQALPKAAAAELRRRGWTERPRHGRSVLAVCLAIGAFAVAIATLIVAAAGTYPTWWQVGAVPATVVTGILSFVFLRYRDRVTDAGAAARDHLKGLRDYLALAEADRLRILQSPEGAERRPVDAGDPTQVLHLYERLLPWAVVWGVEKEWAEALDTRVRETGDDLHWYAGANGFSTAAFSSTFTSLQSASAPDTTSSGSGSFSGGSFGGGFSGGGMGGGSVGGR